jgi:hypothetical protein
MEVGSGAKTSALVFEKFHICPFPPRFGSPAYTLNHQSQKFNSRALIVKDWASGNSSSLLLPDFAPGHSIAQNGYSGIGCLEIPQVNFESALGG